MKAYYVSDRESAFSDKIGKATMDDVLEFVGDKKAGVSLDTETTGLDPHTEKVLLLQIGTAQKQFVIDGLHPQIKRLKPVLEDKTLRKLVVNGGFDHKMILSNFGIRVENYWDVARADEVIYNGVFNDLVPDNATKSKMLYMKSFSMAALAKRHLGITVDKSRQKTFVNRRLGSLFFEEDIVYSAMDLVYPELIQEKQLEKIRQYGLMACVNLENEVVPVIAEMEYNGIKLDTAPWIELAEKNEKELDEVIDRLDDLIVNKLKLGKYRNGELDQLRLFDDGTKIRLSNINWKSPAALLAFLQDNKIDIDNTSRKSLLEQQGEHTALISTLLMARELFKSTQSYGKKFLDNINPKTGRIHPSFNQLYPTTGRVSCDNPKQNWVN